MTADNRNPERTLPLAVHAAEARNLVAALREAGIDDEESLDLSVESETGLAEGISALIGVNRDREAIMAAIDRRMHELGSRKAKMAGYVARDEAKIIDALERLGRNVRTPDGTAYVIQGRRSARPVNEAETPDEFVEIVTVRRPKKGAITRALLAGRDVSGWELSNGAPSLGVRP